MKTSCDTKVTTLTLASAKKVTFDIHMRMRRLRSVVRRRPAELSCELTSDLKTSVKGITTMTTQCGPHGHRRWRCQVASSSCHNMSKRLESSGSGSPSPSHDQEAEWDRVQCARASCRDPVAISVLAHRAHRPRNLKPCLPHRRTLFLCARALNPRCVRLHMVPTECSRLRSIMDEPHIS